MENEAFVAIVASVVRKGAPPNAAPMTTLVKSAAFHSPLSIFHFTLARS